MFAVIGRGLFYEVAPARFGTLGKAFFTLFQLITLDDWFYMYSDVVAKSPGFYCLPRRHPQWFVTWRAKRTSALESKVLIPFIFTAKFVVSRSAFCKLRRDSAFCLFCQSFKIEIHQSQTMTFFTRSSEHLFSKRSARMIDRTEKPKIPLTFATEGRKQSFRISGVCDVINSNCLIYLLNHLSFLSVQ